MTTANWLTLLVSLLVSLVGFAVTWGGLLVRVKVAEAQVRTLEGGRERQGERVGAVEERLATLEGAAGGNPRPRTRTRGVPTKAEE